MKKINLITPLKPMKRMINKYKYILFWLPFIGVAFVVKEKAFEYSKEKWGSEGNFYLTTVFQAFLYAIGILLILIKYYYFG